ncbi:MAG: OB-fold domain-containing protein [Pseudomonadota bacterium]
MTAATTDLPLDALGPEARFRAELAAGQFMLQRDVATGKAVFPPRLVAPGSGAVLEWFAPSGLGTVYATTVTRRRPEQGGDVNVAMIDLDEGCRMMSRVTGVAPEEVRIGMRVKARVEELGGAPQILFAPAAG